MHYAVERANKILGYESKKENDTENMVPIYTLMVQFPPENAVSSSHLIRKEE